MKVLFTLPALVVSSALLTACVTSGPGSAPGAVPPQLVDVDGTVGWDRPEAFGPVPAERQAEGDSKCGATGKAIGFHHAAKDLNGNTITEGSFFCG